MNSKFAMTRAHSEASILERIALSLGHKNLTHTRATYRAACSAIAEELQNNGTAFLPGVGWISLSVANQEDGKLRATPGFRASRVLKDRLKDKTEQRKR